MTWSNFLAPEATLAAKLCTFGSQAMFFFVVLAQTDKK